MILEVQDTGCGMTPDTIARIFDPFFTTKFVGRGLGLAAVTGILRGHRGAMHIDSAPGEGTTIRVYLPACTAPAAKPESTPHATPVPPVGSGTLLLVDDEAPVLAVGRQVLERKGYRVLTARDGREALEVIRDHAEEVQCVVLDLTMPRMDGERCYRELRELGCEIPVILTSGFTEHELRERFSRHGFAGFIHKPYRGVELLRAVGRVLA